MVLGDVRGGRLPEQLVGFGRALRRAGVPADTARLALALQAVQAVRLDARHDFQAALRCTLVQRQHDLAVFDDLFDAWFRTPGLAQPWGAQTLTPQPPASEDQPSPRAREALAVPLVQSEAAQPEDIVRDAAMSASAARRLRQADFARLNASEFRLIDALVREVPLHLPPLRARRTVAGPRGPIPDASAAMKRALQHGGELIDLPRRQRRERPLPLLVLIDVSGSMERYARLLLAFLHRATTHHPRAAFAFGHDLTDLNAAFRLHDTDRMLEAANVLIQDFGAGTRIGASIGALRERHAHRLVGRRTVVLLITDGLDTGQPSVLDRELGWLGRHCRRLLWLNPLLRFEGYEPLATGAQALHRHAHGMLAVHNLDRLGALAHAIARLVRAFPADHARH